MLKLLGYIFILTIFLQVAPVCFATYDPSFVSLVNPLRGEEFWDKKDQQPETSVKGEAEILKQFNIQATWLLRFDALSNQKIIDVLNGLPNHEKGLFLEVIPSLSKVAQVEYHKSDNWHAAGSAFLTGYERWEREKLINVTFEKFKKVFGFTPTSVGSWWIDSYSLEYMHKKYGITAALVVADQYTTDNYQIWGQYFSTPYYPSKQNALHPASSMENKLPIVIMQWAPRDPVNAYGRGVEESTYSIQANDYLDYHGLNTSYFSSLVDIYTKQQFNQFGHLVMGLENSYSWGKYGLEYQRQVKALVDKSQTGQLQIVLMKDFAAWYKNSFPNLSPQQMIIAQDPLGSDKKAVWFMNPYYRAGWFFNKDGSVFRDLRQYIEGEEEICYKRACSEVNFATFTTRVLDDVTYGNKWLIDEGKISEFKVTKSDDKSTISYLNEAGRRRNIEFLIRDISIDGKIYSIDQAILDATKQDVSQIQKGGVVEKGFFKWSLVSVISKVIRFGLFWVLACLIPGLVLIRKVLDKKTAFPLKIFLSTIVGLVVLTLLFYIASMVKLRFLIPIYTLVTVTLFIRFHVFTQLKFHYPNFKNWFNFISVGLILVGTIFQAIPVFKSGLVYPYGLGFWGPNTHDGIWHIALINQLIKDVPPDNPILAEAPLKNYHFFYDLLIAATSYLSNLPVLDLVFRFYPIIFSLLLGIGTYYLVINLFESYLGILKTKIAAIFSLYLVYFAGSFGWIVEFIKLKHLGGESAFWANQSISFNLNPPFAISLIIIIAIFQLLSYLIKFQKTAIFVLAILSGTLVAFKAYAGVLILTTLFLTAVIKRSFSYLTVFLTAAIISASLFLSNFSLDTKLIIFSPFWFIHSMIDSPDRIGWSRLSLARTTSFAQGNWFKFLATETFGLFIFIIGNLGTRLFVLLSLSKIKTIWQQTKYLFLLIFSCLALLIPILFIQAGNPWNTIQFIYYFLYTSALVGGIVTAQIVTKLSKNFALLFIITIIIITPINSWATANGYLSYQPHAKISNKELQALQFLASKEDGVVLIYPYDGELKKRLSEPWPILAYDSTAYVSALTQKAAFVEDEPQNQILLTDYKKRIVASKDFFLIQNAKGYEFLKTNNIKFIYLPKIFKVSLDSDKLAIRLIYENDEVQVYEVISI